MAVDLIVTPSVFASVRDAPGVVRSRHVPSKWAEFGGGSLVVPEARHEERGDGMEPTRVGNGFGYTKFLWTPKFGRARKPSTSTLGL